MGSIFKKALQDPVGKLAGKAFGQKTFAGLDLGGQVLGQYDNLYKPADIPAAPSQINNDASAYEARDRIRRIAKRAQGIDSTVRTSSAGAPYTGQPTALLGG